ncbi:unnamed protein product, partial [Musa banksii]
AIVSDSVRVSVPQHNSSILIAMFDDGNNYVYEVLRCDAVISAMNSESEEHLACVH